MADGRARAALEAERDRLRHQAEELRRTFDQLVDAADLEPPDDEHDPDGTTAYERAQVSSLRSAALERIAEIEVALAAIDAGRYGTCEVCGDPIPEERLVAVPGTMRCVRCATMAR